VRVRSRSLSAWLGSLIGCAIGLAGLHAGFERLGIEAGASSLGLIHLVAEWRSEVERLRHSEAGPVIAFTGDSLLLALPDMEEAGAVPIPEMLEKEIGRIAPERGIRIAPLRWGGFDTTENLFLADEIVASGVDAAILSFNLASLSAYWQKSHTRGELAGWIAVDRVLATLALPIHSIGLTVDSLLLYVALKNMELTPAWAWLRAEQLRARRIRRVAEAAIAKRTGNNAERRFWLAVLGRQFRLPRVEGTNRESLESAQRRYGEALSGVGDDDPILRMLAAVLARWRAAGVEVLVVVMPVNVEHFAFLGLLDERDGLERSVEALERIVIGAGAGFVDLHDRLDDRGFRDPAGHLSFEGEVDGPSVVARALAPLVNGLVPAEPARVP